MRNFLNTYMQNGTSLDRLSAEAESEDILFTESDRTNGQKVPPPFVVSLSNHPLR